MDEEGKSDDVHHHLTSAAAFVEGGIQEACDDSCSICLESFETDPSTVTSCKHEFHLQCILEWCQRSSQCPMCWQLISLKDPSSQELLDAVEHERNIRLKPPTRNTTIFRHPTLGDFELQHLPASATTGSELEEQIIQHLAAAAAMGSRTRHIARRELGHERGSDDHGVHPHFLMFSTHPNTPRMQIGEDQLDPSASVTITAPPSSVSTQESVAAAASGSTSITTSHHGSTSSSSSSNNHESPNHQEKAGPSDLQSFSEAIRSRFNTLTMRYKESITKGTRGWKDRLLSRNTNNSEERKVGGMNEGTTSAAAAVSGQTDNSITDSVDNHHQLMEPI